MAGYVSKGFQSSSPPTYAAADLADLFILWQVYPHLTYSSPMIFKVRYLFENMGLKTGKVVYL